jgi:hypothetical protein
MVLKSAQINKMRWRLVDVINARNTLAKKFLIIETTGEI